MSQGARTRIGLAAPYRSRTPRTLNEAFGPYSRLDVPATRNKLDSIIGAVCVAIIAGVLIWNFWGTL